MATLKRIIVPLDGSELSERILPYVEGLAKNLDLEVNLIGITAVRCLRVGPVTVFIVPVR